MCETVYNTPMNTIGIGNAIPAGINTLGSGDLFQFSTKRKKISSKKHNKIKNIKSINYNLTPPLIVYTKK